MSEKNPNIRFKPQIGENNVKDFELDGMLDEYEFRVESNAVFKRLAEDIYNGKSAGVREALTNSITAIFRAVEEGHLSKNSEGIITFEIFENERKLIIRDNGIGMTRDEISEIISVIGKSSSHSESHLTGKFGMGFLALWMLVGGVNGGFMMHTNPRGIDEGPISGIWTSNSFKEYEPDDLNCRLSNNDYGTEFEIIMGTDIDIDDVIDWIYKYCEFSRIPVLFKHHTKDDELKDDEFIPEKITDKYENFEDEKYENTFYSSKDELKYYIISNDYFTAVNSTLRTNKHIGTVRNVISLDIPIDCKSTHFNSYPYNSVEIRFKSEIPIVCAGPNEGKYVISESQKNNFESNNAIVESDLNINDIVTPAPTGTRDSIENMEEFTEWLSDKFYSIHYDEISEPYKNINTIEDYKTISDEKCDGFHEFINKITKTYNKKLDSKELLKLKQKTKVSFNNEFEKVLPDLHSGYISLAVENTNNISKQKYREMFLLRKLYRKSIKNDIEVYMGHRLTQEKAEFIWDSKGKKYVIRVDKNKQQVYEKVFGWNKISEINFETSLQMSQEKRNKYTTENKDISDKNIKIHLDSYSNTTNIKISKLKEKIKNEDNKICKLVLFKKGEYSISSNKSVTSDIIATASVSKDIYDYLISVEDIMCASEVIDEDIIIPGSDGKMYDISKDIDNSIVTHIINEESIDSFRNNNIMKNIEEYLKSIKKTPDNLVYLPMTEVEYKLKYNTNSIDRKNKYYYRNIKSQNISERYTKSLRINDVELYIKAQYHEETPIINALKTVNTYWNEGGKEIVELFENNK